MSFTVPGMWADHHVLEVRQVLCVLDGVEEVVAQAMPRTVTVRFDPARTDAAAIARRLEAAAYSVGEVPEPDERPEEQARMGLERVKGHSDESARPRHVRRLQEVLR